MTINENLSEREMHREKKRNDFRRRSFARMYNKSATFEADYAESEAKLAKMLKLAAKPGESTYNDSDATSSQSMRDFIGLLRKVGKIDPNQAFIEHKNKSKELSIEDVIDSLRKDI